MSTLRAMRVLTMFVATVVVAPSAQAAPAYKLLKKVAYANVDDKDLEAEVVVPTGKTNGLGVIFVASGAGYMEGGKINNREEARIAETFCGRGYTVFIVRPGPSVKYGPVAMADHVQRAIVFLKENAEQFGVDADRLGLLGTAPAVHLVSLVAITADADTAVKAAGVYIAPTDFRDKGAQNLYIQANNKGWEQIIKDSFPDVTAVPPTSAAPEVDGGAQDPRVKLPQVSPNAPRFLIVHGDADPLVLKGNSSLFFKAMRNAGVSTDMVVKRPGADPGPTIQAEVSTLANWFDKQLTQE